MGSKEEAIEWACRAPFADGVLEVRQVFDDADFAEHMSPESAEREAQLRAQVEGS